MEFIKKNSLAAFLVGVGCGLVWGLIRLHAMLEAAGLGASVKQAVEAQ